MLDLVDLTQSNVGTVLLLFDPTNLKVFIGTLNISTGKNMPGH